MPTTTLRPGSAGGAVTPFARAPLAEPAHDCPFCARLVAFRIENRAANPDWHNAPVPAFGSAESRLLVVGLAPGRRGANRTGRPFTGDFAGQLLYPTLVEAGFAAGSYGQAPDDGLRLIDCRVTNAVRCVPPENKPTPAEIATCNPFLAAEIAGMPKLKALLALGAIAHGAVLASFGLKVKDRPFGHGARHTLPNGLLLADSYHCSRQNTNTGRLTPDMFRNVVFGIRDVLAAGGASEKPQG